MGRLDSGASATVSGAASPFMPASAAAPVADFTPARTPRVPRHGLALVRARWLRLARSHSAPPCHPAVQVPIPGRTCVLCRGGAMIRPSCSSRPSETNESAPALAPLHAASHASLESRRSAALHPSPARDQCPLLSRTPTADASRRVPGHPTQPAHVCLLAPETAESMTRACLETSAHDQSGNEDRQWCP